MITLLNDISIFHHKNHIRIFDRSLKANADVSADGAAETGGRAAYDNYRANRERKLKFSYKEKMEYETIEQDILDL